MTVRELIKSLETLPPDYAVYAFNTHCCKTRRLVTNAIVIEREEQDPAWGTTHSPEHYPLVLIGDEDLMDWWAEAQGDLP